MYVHVIVRAPFYNFYNLDFERLFSNVILNTAV